MGVGLKCTYGRYNQQKCLTLICSSLLPQNSRTGNLSWTVRVGVNCPRLTSNLARISLHRYYRIGLFVHVGDSPPSRVWFHSLIKLSLQPAPVQQSSNQIINKQHKKKKIQNLINLKIHPICSNKVENIVHLSFCFSWLWKY